MRASSEHLEERVLVLALFGADSALTVRILESASIATEVCADVEALCAAIEQGAGAVLVAEEALLPQAAERLVATLDAQPQWADLPILVSAIAPEAASQRGGRMEALGSRANISLLERPIRVRAMVSAVQAALRARRRQYETRDLLAEREGILEAEREARARAESANLAKDAFLATVSHELRTPLNAVLGWARMLSAGMLDDEKKQRALEAIERNAVSQAQIIEDLLDISRITSGKLRLEIDLVDVTRVAEAAIDAVRPAIEAKSQRFSSSIDSEVAPLVGDPVRLQQIIWNLLANAIKFTPKGGRIELQVKRVQHQIEVSVTDSGEGIDAAFLPYLFQRFQQEDQAITRRQGGLGLGLALCRHLVELHGGRIEAFSEGRGHGSTFVARLPCAVTPNTPAAGARVQPKFDTMARFERPSELSGLSILVVDDEDDTRDLLATILADCGAVLHKAASGKEGIGVLRSVHPDVLISDIGMPQMDGYEFIRTVRALPAEEGGRTPAAALTAYARAEDRRQALKAGYEIHIAKPVEPAELVMAVGTMARIARAMR